MDTYKGGQGSLARLTAAVAVIALFALGAIELHSWIYNPKTDAPLIDSALTRDLPLFGVPLTFEFLICLAIGGGGFWVVRRYLSRPQVVDALIETESEMKKVSWPTRAESWNASVVVIIVTIVLTASLALFDIVLTKVFELFF